MKKQWTLWLMLLVLIGGWALANPDPSNPTSSDSTSSESKPPDLTKDNPVTAVNTLFSVIFPNDLRETLLAWAKKISGMLTVPISELALALFVLALIYRIYQLWLSEASSSSLIYSVIRYAFIGAFLLSANFYLKQNDTGQPLKLDSQPCSKPVLVLSHIGYCAWESGLESGKQHVKGDIPKLETAVSNFIAGFTSTVMAANFFRTLGEADKITRSIRAAMRDGGPKTNTKGAADRTDFQLEKRDHTAEEKSWTHDTLALTKLLPFAVYFLLAIPSLIYSFMVIISGLTVIFSIILLPIAIALIAWGFITPILSIAYNILAQAITVFLLPAIFVLGFVFVLERPAAAVNGMSQQVESIINDSTKKISGGWENLETVVSGEVQQKKEEGAGIVGTLLKGFENIVKGLLGIGIAILMSIIMIIIGGIFFIVIVAFSYSAGISLIGAVPNIILSLLGANNMDSPNLRSPPALGPTARRLFLGR